MLRRRQAPSEPGRYLPLYAMERPPSVDSEKSVPIFASEAQSDICEIGVNTVNQCSTIEGTESKLSTSTNLAKCICGAGSFALPHVFLEEGVIGGTLAITICGYLATVTMQSLADSRQLASVRRAKPITSYVQLARETLGERAANLVFTLTLSASLGVCSTYLVFIGQTLESMSFDTTTMNVLRQIAPDVSEFTWELLAAVVLFPLSLIRDYSLFSFTSHAKMLPVFSIIGAIASVLPPPPAHKSITSIFGCGSTSNETS